MTRFSFLICLFFMPLTLQAQVYRCDTSEGTIYSQMPCAENAERLAEYDAEVEVDISEGASASENSPEPEVKQPSAMENFISTLEKQRAAQFRTIDANIRTLQLQLNATGTEAPDESTREMLETELATLTTERTSINDQYVAMINEASNRTGSGQGVN